MGHDVVVKIILYGDDRTRPTHFDPDMLEILLKHGEDFDEIYRKSRETEE
jgi:hypothetical protein